MSFIELKFLILAQIGMDIAIIIVFIFFLKRLRHPNKGKSEAVKIFESILLDADKTAGQFKDQLEEKHDLIKRLNEQLDKRIASLNMLLNRADVLLSHPVQSAEVNDDPLSVNRQQTRVIELAKEGHRVEEIANMLSIPKGEVKLVLDLKQKLSQMGTSEGVS